MCKYKEEMPDVRCRMSDFYFFEVEDFFNVHFLYRIIRDPSLPKYKRFVETRTLAEPWLKCSNIHLLNTSKNAVHRGIYFMNTSEDGMYRGIYSMKTPEQEKFSGVQQNFRGIYSMNTSENAMYRGVYFMKTSEKEMIFEESQMNTFENQLFITNCLFNEPLHSLHSPIM